MGRTKLMKYGVSPNRLTDKQTAFVMYYCICMNASQAAIEAGYSKKTAAAQGAKLLKNTLVKRMIGKVIGDRIEEQGLTLEGVLQELAYMVHRDPLDLCDEQGYFQITDMRNIPKRIRHCIDGLKVRQIYNSDGGIQGQELELKFGSKSAAIDMAMKYYGAYAPEKLQVQNMLDWDKALEQTTVQPQITQDK